MSLEVNAFVSICDLWGDSERDSDSESDSENETNMMIDCHMGPVYWKDSLSKPGMFLQCGYSYLVSWW